MILKFKEEAYGVGDTFYIYDENHKRKYYVDSGSVLFSQKYQICDLNKKTLVTIKNEPKSVIKKKNYIYKGNEKVATITKEFPSLTNKFIIEGLNWEKRGVLRKQYEVYENDNKLFSMGIDSTDFGLSPVLTIEDGVDELTALAVALTISYVTAPKEDDELPTHHL